LDEAGVAVFARRAPLRRTFASRLNVLGLYAFRIAGEIISASESIRESILSKAKSKIASRIF
jgi:hypothetical protein